MAGRRPWSQPIPKVLRAGTGIVRPWVQGEAEDRGKGAAEPQAKTAEPARVRKRAAPLHHPGRGRCRGGRERAPVQRIFPRTLHGEEHDRNCPHRHRPLSVYAPIWGIVRYFTAVGYDFGSHDYP